MLRFKLIMLSLFAVFAVSAVASASASAEACEHEAGSGTFVLCEGLPLLLVVGNLILHVEQDEKAKYVLKNAVLSVTCEAVVNENEKKEKVGTLDSEKGSVKVLALVLKFSKCSATANCEVKEPIFTLVLEGVVDGKELILFYPAAAGTHFSTLTLKGEKCALPGKIEVTTEKGLAKVGPLCEAPEIEITKELHLILCVAAKSHLEFGKKPAEFSGPFDAKLLLSNGTFDLWDVVEGK